MSRLWFNIRFGRWHLQIGPDSPMVRFAENIYFRTHQYDTWFEVYCAFGHHYD